MLARPSGCANPRDLAVPNFYVSRGKGRGPGLMAEPS